MMANGNANIIEFDDSTGGFINGSARNSGVLLQQDTSATISSINGGYAFGFLGVDSNKNRFGVAGAFNADGAGNFTNGELDSNDSGSLSSAVSFTGAYAIATTGRGTATIGNSHYSFYVAKPTVTQPSELLVVGIDPFVPGGNPLVSGTILQQSNNGSFGIGNLNGPGVFELTALDPAGPTAQSQVGVFDASGGNGQFNLTSDQNTGGTLTSPCSGTATQCAPGTDTVAPNGSRDID